MSMPIASGNRENQNEPMMPGEAQLPGLRYGVIVHAAGEPGRIVSIDTTAAIAAGAVVITGQETLGVDPYHGPVVRDRSLLAIDRVRYRGEPVAAVVATSPEAAQSAADAMTVTVSPLPATTTGARPGSARLVHLTDLLRPGALADRAPLVRHDGNRIAALTRAFDRDLGVIAIEASFETGLALPLMAPAEPLRATARWEDGKLTVWSNCRDAKAVRAELAVVFDLPVSDVSVFAYAGGHAAVPGVIGIEGIAAALAQRARQPVQLVAPADAFGWVGPRATLTSGANGAVLSIDAGAVAGYLPIWLDALAELAAEQLQAVRIAAEVVYSERPPVAATLDEWKTALSALTPERTALTPNHHPEGTWPNPGRGEQVSDGQRS